MCSASCAPCCSRRRTWPSSGVIPVSAAASSTTCSCRASRATPPSAPTTTACSGSALRCSRRPAPAVRRGDPSTLDVWDGHLARHGAALLAGRLELVAAIAPLAVEAFAEVAPTSDAIALEYRSGLDGELPGGAAELEVLLVDALARVRRQEIERGVCLVGPHRDDLELRLGAGPAKGYASHGESWALALALRLASYRLLRADDVEPVLLLDDVFAELDARRRRALADVARRAEQVLITAAVAEDVPEGLDDVRFAVDDAGVRRAPPGVRRAPPMIRTNWGQGCGYCGQLRLSW